MINSQEEYNKKHYLYTPLFCEENIWQLVLSLSKTNPKINMSEMWVLMITNPDKKIALINQQAAAINQAIIWDYHVILLAEINHLYFIFDFDTRLPFVTTLQNYIQNTFIPANNLPPEFIPYIRKIPAQLYLEQFYSDRSHMQNQIEQSEFPPWPIINTNTKHRTTLADFLDIEHDLDDNSPVFKMFSTARLEQWLTSPP
jgi:hypothetical protein